MDRETALIINDLFHRVSAEIGKIVREKEIFDDNMKNHIAALSLAKQEILNLITLDEKHEPKALDNLKKKIEELHENDPGALFDFISEWRKDIVKREDHKIGV